MTLDVWNLLIQFGVLVSAVATPWLLALHRSRTAQLAAIKEKVDHIDRCLDKRSRKLAKRIGKLEVSFADRTGRTDD